MEERLILTLTKLSLASPLQKLLEVRAEAAETSLERGIPLRPLRVDANLRSHLLAELPTPLHTALPQIGPGE